MSSEHQKLPLTCDAETISFCQIFSNRLDRSSRKIHNSTTEPSVEKWFFNNKSGTGIFTDILEDFATEMGKPRIDAIQGMQDYFADLQTEFGFIEAMHDKVVKVDGNKYQYRIVNNFKELNAAMEENALKIGISTVGGKNWIDRLRALTVEVKGTATRHYKVREAAVVFEVRKVLESWWPGT